LPSGSFSLLVVGGYFVLGIVAYWPMFPGDPHLLFTKANADPVETAWVFAWAAHALTQGHNLFFTTAVDVPTGLNLAQATGMPLLGIVAAPITLLFGPVSSSTLFMVASMPLSATAAYAVLRRWRIWSSAAALGGLAYGFSPYMVNQGGLHLNLAFAPLPPLIAAAVVKIVSRPTRPLRWGAVLGGLVVAQFFISSEVLAITAVIVVLGLLLAALHCLQFERKVLRSVAMPALQSLAVALPIIGALLAYPLWFEFDGPRHYSGPPWPLYNPWHADALAFVAPTPHQAIRPVLSAAGKTLSSAAADEAGAYLGFAVLAMAVVLAWYLRRSPRGGLAACLGTMSALLSLGPVLVLDGDSTHRVLPFYYLAELPVLDGILPIRFALATAACVAALVAFGLDCLYRTGQTRPALLPRGGFVVRRPVVGLAASFVVLVGSWLPAWPYPSQAVRMLPTVLTRALPSGDPVVLTYPYLADPEDRALLWQAEGHFSFRLLGNYGIAPDSHGRATNVPPLLGPPAVQEFLVEQDNSEWYPPPPPLGRVIAETRVFVRRYDVRAVIVDLTAPHATTVANMLAKAFGPNSLTVGGFELWVV
jgi:hypothetical protein